MEKYYCEIHKIWGADSFFETTVFFKISVTKNWIFEEMIKWLILRMWILGFNQRKRCFPNSWRLVKSGKNYSKILRFILLGGGRCISKEQRPKNAGRFLTKLLKFRYLLPPYLRKWWKFLFSSHAKFSVFLSLLHLQLMLVLSIKNLARTRKIYLSFTLDICVFQRFQLKSDEELFFYANKKRLTDNFIMHSPVHGKRDFPQTFWCRSPALANLYHRNSKSFSYETKSFVQVMSPLGPKKGGNSTIIGL